MSAAAGWLSFLFPPPSSSILPPPSVVIFSFPPSTPDPKLRLVLFVCRTTPIWHSEPAADQALLTSAHAASASSPGLRCAAIPARSRLFEGGRLPFSSRDVITKPSTIARAPKPSGHGDTKRRPYSRTAALRTASHVVAFQLSTIFVHRAAVSWRDGIARVI